MILFIVNTIPSQYKRYRRHLSGTDVCQVCKGGIETILHVLRDCPAMRGIWDRFVPAAKRQTFFSMPLFEWLYKNLSDNGTGSEIPWPTTFALAVWWGWKWRCGNIFGKNSLWRDRVGFLRNLAKEVMSANEAAKGNSNVDHRTEIMVGWAPPRSGWMKLNTDGSSHGNPGAATDRGPESGSDRFGDSERARRRSPATARLAERSPGPEFEAIAPRGSDFTII